MEGRTIKKIPDIKSPELAVIQSAAKDPHSKAVIQSAAKDPHSKAVIQSAAKDLQMVAPYKEIPLLFGSYASESIGMTD